MKDCLAPDDQHRPSRYPRRASRISRFPSVLAAAALISAALTSPELAQAQVKASLVARDTSVQSGKPFVVALRLQHERPWHTYWLNPGIGQATSIVWTLPEGWQADGIDWPTPIPIYGADGSITGHGYEGVTYLPVTITPVAKAVVGQSVTLAASVNWLMCITETCIPDKAQLRLTLPVSPDPPAPNAEVRAELAKMPIPQASPKGWKLQATRTAERVTLRIEGAGELNAPHFFGEEEEYIAFDEPQVVKEEGGGYTFVLPLFDDPPTEPDRLVGVLAYIDAAGIYRGARIDVPFVSPARATSVTGASVSDSPAPMRAEPLASASTSFIATLLLGVLGGLILNLMPCVFPVLGIKVLSFVGQAGSARIRIRRHGVVFTLGVLLSFWVLAGVLAFVRVGGEQLGWGFQLQSPAFVFVLTVVMLVFGLNLSGVFEVAPRASGIGARLQMKSGYIGSFFTGVLATVVATPCSAPFLAPALGAALTLSVADSFAVFTAIAMGLSAPYLLLSIFPDAVKLLPRSGAWMETFKQLMAFPLYATAGYLVWVLAGQVSEDALLAVLLGLTLIALGLWVYGRWHTLAAKPMRARLSLVGCLLISALGISTGWPSASAPSDVVWEKWSAQRVEQLRGEGRPIYVDFTARWCATCQANKKLVFGSKELLHAFADKNVATLKADWTNQDPEITAELAKWGRSAVPFNLVYLPGGTAPKVLPELLTPGIVLDTFRPE